MHEHLVDLRALARPDARSRTAVLGRQQLLTQRRRGAVLAGARRVAAACGVAQAAAERERGRRLAHAAKLLPAHAICQAVLRSCAKDE
eukprot:362837-Chlamydomonas_euryale.AAC.9